MKVSQSQILRLFIIALASLINQFPVGLSREDRQRLVDEIINQQDVELQEYFKR